MKYKAFTLAEVLVTLAVIGVVAALSIPAIVQNSEEAGVAARVIKYQSLLSQAFDQYAVDKGCVGNLACTGAFAGNPDHAALWSELKPYFNVAKDCGTAAGQGCFPPGVTYKWLNGDPRMIYDDESFVKAILADGTILSMGDNDLGNCTADGSRNSVEPFNSLCGWVMIDVNGHTGPNQSGRDVFHFFVLKQGVYPAGSLDDKWYTDTEGNPECDPTAALDDGGEGQGCAAKVIKERAINY